MGLADGNEMSGAILLGGGDVPSTTKSGSIGPVSDELREATRQATPRESLAAELGMTLEDFGHITPRMDHEMPLVSKSTLKEQSMESEESGGVVLGAAGIHSLEPGVGGIEGHTLDPKSSSLLGVLEKEKRRQNAHLHYLHGGMFSVPKSDEHFYTEFETESRVYEQIHYVDNVKARITRIGDGNEISQKVTEAKIKRYEELMERVSKIGADDKYEKFPGLSPTRGRSRSPLNLGSPTNFDLKINLDPARSPRCKDEYTSVSGDPWEIHIKTQQDRAWEVAEERKDNRVARSLLVKGPKDVPTDITNTYRSESIGHEYGEKERHDDENTFFEKEYIRKIAAVGVSSYDYFEPSAAADADALPQPLASVLNELKEGKSGLDMNDPPVLSPSKKELEDYISSIPGMKRFSPREPLKPREDGEEEAGGRGPRFQARTITESRAKQKKEQLGGKDLTAGQKRRVKKKVKAEISEAQKTALMHKALQEAEKFMRRSKVQ